MIPCPHALEDLSAYIDGELKPEEHHVLRRHLGTCRSCQYTITALMTLKEALSHTSDMYPLPPTLRTVLRVPSLPSRRTSCSFRALFRRQTHFKQ